MEAAHITTDLQGNFRPDILFSYWIFAWFLFYYFLARRVRWLNPRLALMLGTFENVAVLVILFWVSARAEIIALYLLMMICVKIWPLWLVWNTPHPRWLATEAAVFCVFFAIYWFWLYIQDMNILDIYVRTFRAIVSGSNQTPFFRVVRAAISSIRMVLSRVGLGAGGQQ